MIRAAPSQPHPNAAPSDPATIRVGFTAAKSVGGAVLRNRAKRRMREVAAALLPRLGRGGTDYVFIALPATATAPWPELLDETEKALVRLNADLAAGKTTQPRRTRPRRGRPSSP